MRTRWVSPRQLLHGGLAVSVIALSGCGGLGNYLDPYQKPYAWHPTGAPAANLAAQVANPHDLVAGRGVTEEDSREPTLSIEQFWQGHTKPLAAGASGGSAAASGSSGGTN
jgi:type IV pilus biogenesis protein CpaD/CtpE